MSHPFKLRPNGHRRDNPNQASPAALALRRQLIEFAGVASLKLVTLDQVRAFRDAVVLANDPGEKRDDAMVVLDGLIANWTTLQRDLWT